MPFGSPAAIRSWRTTRLSTGSSGSERRSRSVASRPVRSYARCCFPGGGFPAPPTTSWRRWYGRCGCRPTGAFTGRLPTPSARRTCSFDCSRRLRGFSELTRATADCCNRCRRRIGISWRSVYGSMLGRLVSWLLVSWLLVSWLAGGWLAGCLRGFWAISAGRGRRLPACTGLKKRSRSVRVDIVDAVAFRAARRMTLFVRDARFVDRVYNDSDSSIQLLDRESLIADKLDRKIHKSRTRESS